MKRGWDIALVFTAMLVTTSSLSEDRREEEAAPESTAIAPVARHEQD